MSPLALPPPNAPKRATEQGAFGPVGPPGPPGPSGAGTGPAGGDLTGSYPDPQIAAGAVTAAHVATANKDGDATVPSLRTLGGGGRQAAPGNHTHALPPSPSLHANPDFELVTGSTPTNWFKYFEVGVCPWVSDPLQAISGTRSLRMDIPATANAQLVVNGTSFATSGGAIVTLSMWAMSNNDLGAASIGLITSPDSGTPYALYETSSVVVGTAWVPITGSFVIKPGHTKATPYLRAGSTPDGVSSVWFDLTSSSQVLTPVGSVLTGSVHMWASSVIPGGYLVCDGSTFDSGTYPDLATVLGDTWGVHVGTTYFLPDLRGRVPLGVGTASPAVPGGTAHTLGQKGGEETHALTSAELASHGHGLGTLAAGAAGAHGHTNGTLSAGSSGSAHFHGVNRGTAVGAASNRVAAGNATDAGASSTQNDGGHSHPIAGAMDNAADHSHALSGAMANTGSSTPFNELPPYVGLTFIIKAS